jgi:hypothetical protein
MPSIASEGIQVRDVTDDSMRIGPPRLVGVATLLARSRERNR